MTGRGTTGGLWPLAVVIYEIDESIPEDLLRMIDTAIQTFQNKTPVTWVRKTDDAEYWVTFKLDCAGCPRAHVGCRYSDTQTIWLPFPNYPGSGPPLQHICILHEMCHCIGLAHEHERGDRDQHIKCDVVGLASTSGVRFGSYDYYSIMHYGHGAGDVHCKSAELRERADRSNCFSAGDLALIRKLYNGRHGHHGDWHEACSASCTPTSCSCGACGPLHGGVNCGYSGMSGHWSCCMSASKTSICQAVTHTGFWHAECDWSKGCNDEECSCNNCGGGCTYSGTKAHWSCCGGEAFKSVCNISPFPAEA